MKRSAFWCLVALFLAANAYMFFYARRSTSFRDEGSDPLRTDLHGGLVGTRARIDDFTTRVAGMDRQQLEASLMVDEPTVLSAGQSPSAIDGRAFFVQCLADRRVAKLSEIYSSFSEAEAEVAVRQLFDLWLERHVTSVSKVVSHFDETGYELGDANLPGSRYACCASLFLASRFCSPVVVDGLVDQWRQVSLNLPSKSVSPVTNERFFSEYARPPYLFLVNLYVNLAVREGSVEIEEVISALGYDSKQWPSIGFCKWDAYTNSLDLTHTARGVPYGRSDVLDSYRCTATWARAVGRCVDLDCMERVSSAARAYAVK